jgi:Tfp pilus assembly protein PilF
MPALPEAHVGLGNILHHQGKYAEAEAECREALRLRPDDPNAHVGLGNSLLRQNKISEAEKAYQGAIRLRPGFPEAHVGLGNALYEQGRLREAEAASREALRLRSGNPEAHIALGNTLSRQGRHTDAEAEFREALRLRPNDFAAQYNLGNSLKDQGKPMEAEASYREALRLKPAIPEALCNLGFVLRHQGRFAESLAFYKRGHELGSKQPNWHYPSEEWVHQAQQLVAFDLNLPRILKGEVRPANAAEQIVIAKLCQEHKKLYAAAARFYGDAFAAEPKRAEDLTTADRYNAACAAALAGSSQGEDSANLDDKERARLRRQALAWLRADLTAWNQLLAKQADKVRPSVLQTMQHWQQDTDFAGVRGQALTSLSEGEHKDWQKLWEEVEALRQRASALK